MVYFLCTTLYNMARKEMIVLAKPNLDNVIMQDGYYGVAYNTRNGIVFYPMGRDFQIKNIFRSFEKGNIILCLTTVYGGSVVSCEYARNNMDNNGVKALQAKGFDVNGSSMDVFHIAISIKEQIY